MAIHGPHFEDSARHWLAGVRIPLVDRQVGPLIVLDGQSACSSREELYFVFLEVDDVVRRGGRLLHRVGAWLQITHQDLPCLVGGAVQVMGAILDLGDAERNACQRRAVCAQLYQTQGGLDAVGEYKLPCLPGLQVDDPLGVIDDIAVGQLLGHTVGARLQLGKVDLTIFIRGELLRAELNAVPFDLEYHIGDHLAGVCRIHFHQVQTRLLVIEEHQLQNAVSGLQLDLLGHDVHYMLIIARHFFHPVGAWLQVSEEDFAQPVCFKRADQVVVFVDLKGDVRQRLMGLPVVFDDAQARLGRIFQRERHSILGRHVDGIGLAILDPTFRRFQLHDLISSRLQLIEGGRACFVGNLCVDSPGLDVLDLHPGSRQCVAGLRIHFFHPQVAVGRILIGDGGHCVFTFHPHLLHRLLCWQMAFGRLLFCNGIQPFLFQPGDVDLTFAVGGIGTHRRAVRVFDLEYRTFQQRAGTRLLLDDLQAVFASAIVIVVRGAVVLEPCIRPTYQNRVGIRNVVLQLAIGTGLLAYSVESGVLMHVAFQ